MSFVEIESKSLQRAMKLLEDTSFGVHEAMGSAAKRTAEKAHTEAGRFAASQYVISKGAFMSKTAVKYHIDSSPTGGSMSITFTGSANPLVEFKTSWSRTNGVTAQVRRDGGGVISSAFMKAIGGHFGVYERVGSERYPVEQKYGPATGSMMKDETVVKEMEETIHETFEKRMEHEMERIMTGGGW